MNRPAATGGLVTYDERMLEVPERQKPAGLYAGLFLGVFAVSVAAPLIRLANAPPLSIASYRLIFAALPVVILAIWKRRQELCCLTGADLRAAVLSGLCLAAHFATWVASLKYATVASSVTLVTTSPFFVAGFAFLVAGERTSRRMLVAIAVCLAGGVIIGAADLGLGGRALFGDGLALMGAVFAAVYFALGRRMRISVSLLTYVGIIYPIAAVALVALTLVARQPLAGFSLDTYLIFGLLALVSQLIGHSSLNWALGFLSAPFVSIAVLGEAVLATVLAALLLAERPGLERVAGSLLILAGVYLAMREEARHAVAHPASA